MTPPSYTGPRRRGAPIAAILLLGPLLVVWWSWWQGGGLPFAKDANETFLSHLHGRNLATTSAWRYAFLTVENAPATSSGPWDVYSHNPNGPRYVHAVLYAAGVRSLSAAVLIIVTVTTLLTGAALIRLCRGRGDAPRLWWVLPAMFAIDWMGNLAWAGNTYRAWCLVLFWALLAAMLRSSRAWTIAGLSLALWQIEFGFAVAVTAAAIAFLWLSRASGKARKTGAFVLGAALSLAVFAIQVLAYLGVDGIGAEITSTIQRRGAAPVGMLEALTRTHTYLSDAWYGPYVWWLCLYALASSIVLRGRGWMRGESPAETHDIALSRRIAGDVVLSMTCGVAAMIGTLRGYYVDGFVQTYLPFLGFGIAAASAVAALDAAAFLGWVSRGLESPVRTALRTFPAVVLLAVGLQTSVAQYRAYPPLGRELMDTLARPELRGESFVAPILFYALAHVMTDGPALDVVPVLPTDDAFRAAGTALGGRRLLYLCVDRRWFGVDCAEVGGALEARGHRVIYRGPDFFVAELVR